MRPARLLGFLLIFLLSFFVFKNVAFAQTPLTNTNPDVPNNLHTWTQNVMIEVMSSLTCLVAGVDPIDPSHQCLGLDPKTHKIGYVQGGGGAIGVVGVLIAMTFTPPAHTNDYIRYLSSNFGLAKPTYAANTDGGSGGGLNQQQSDRGIGFGGLTPLLEIWTALRNITYLLFVIIFVVIGFAIMLRVHIDPRTVMTIENQIPKIVVALILVTFSFAIAGLLIDLMYVSIYLVMGVFDSINIPHAVNAVNTANSADFKNIWGLNPLEIANNLPVPGSLGGLAKGGLIGISANASASVTKIIADLFSGLVSIPIVSQIFQGIVGILAFLIIAVAILFALFRLWFTLIMAYIFILLDVIFVPFWILAGLIPGGSLSFTAWLREIGGELLAFPAAIVMMLLAKTFLTMDTKSLFIPPLIGNPSTEGFGALMGLGVLLMTPTAVSMMKGWLKAPKFDIAAIGQAVGVGAAVPGRAIGGVGSLAFGVHYDKNGQTIAKGGALGQFLRSFGFVR
ncbi:MAG TPA: hypothetical protein VKC89_03125 [Patescibacteria group bacterium]|nr:hypothetical protein [Patescibacteria group bacterium]